jgi:hypothetical protein
VTVAKASSGGSVGKGVGVAVTDGVGIGVGLIVEIAVAFVSVVLVARGVGVSFGLKVGDTTIGLGTIGLIVAVDWLMVVGWQEARSHIHQPIAHNGLSLTSFIFCPLLSWVYI